MQLTFENIGEHVVLLAGGAFISRLMTNLVMMIIAGGAFISRSIMWCITRLWMSYRIHNTNLNWLFVWVRYYSRVISETVARSVAHCFSIPMLNLHSNTGSGEWLPDSSLTEIEEKFHESLRNKEPILPVLNKRLNRSDRIRRQRAEW